MALQNPSLPVAQGRDTHDGRWPPELATEIFGLCMGPKKRAVSGEDTWHTYSSRQHADRTKGKFSGCPQEGRPVCSASADSREEGRRQETSPVELVGEAQFSVQGDFPAPQPRPDSLVYPASVTQKGLVKYLRRLRRAECKQEKQNKTATTTKRPFASSKACMLNSLRKLFK